MKVRKYCYRLSHLPSSTRGFDNKRLPDIALNILFEKLLPLAEFIYNNNFHIRK